MVFICKSCNGRFKKLASYEKHCNGAVHQRRFKVQQIQDIRDIFSSGWVLRIHTLSAQTFFPKHISHQKQQIQGPVMLLKYTLPSKFIYLFGDIHLYGQECSKHSKKVPLTHLWTQIVQKHQRQHHAVLDFFIEDEHHKESSHLAHIKHRCYLDEIRNWCLEQNKSSRDTFVRIHKNDARSSVKALFMRQVATRKQTLIEFFHAFCLKHFKVSKQLAFCNQVVSRHITTWLLEKSVINDKTQIRDLEERWFEYTSIYMDAYTVARMFRTQWCRRDQLPHTGLHNIFVYTGLLHTFHYQELINRISSTQPKVFSTNSLSKQCLVMNVQEFEYYSSVITKELHFDRKSKVTDIYKTHTMFDTNFLWSMEGPSTENQACNTTTTYVEL